MLHRPTVQRRPGKVLVLFALLLPALFGILGLVLDLGFVMSNHRQAQNAVDAAVMAAANEKLKTDSDSAAFQAAQNLFNQTPGMEGATLSLNVPPTSGPYAGNPDFIEGIVTKPVPTFFITVAGGPAQTEVIARAVAGLEQKEIKESIIALNPSTLPGLSVPGLSVVGLPVRAEGPIAINTVGTGRDQDGELIVMDNPLPSVLTALTGKVTTPDIRVVGGVDFPGNFKNIDPDGENPLRAGELPVEDPLLHLPTPTSASGVINRYPGTNGARYLVPQDLNINLTGIFNDITLEPGIYSSINILGESLGTVTFEPGIYVIKGGLQGLRLITLNKVIAEGVMFYVTGQDFDLDTGAPDNSDGGSHSLLPPLSTLLSEVEIAAPNGTFTALNESGSPFNGMLIYNRRRNGMPVTLQAKTLNGTIYAKWSPTTVVGPGEHRAQLVVGNVILSRLPLLGKLTFLSGEGVKPLKPFLVE